MLTSVSRPLANMEQRASTHRVLDSLAYVAPAGQARVVRRTLTTVCLTRVQMEAPVSMQLALDTLAHALSDGADLNAALILTIALQSPA